MIVRYVALCAAHAHTHGTHTWHAHALASNTLWPEVASAGFDGYQFFYLPHQDPVPRRALAAFGFAIALTASTPGDHSTCTHDTHLTATPCLFTFSPAFIVCRLPSLCGSTLLQTKVISIATHQNVLYTHAFAHIITLFQAFNQMNSMQNTRSTRRGKKVVPAGLEPATSRV